MARLVDRSIGRPTWIDDDRFWYRVTTPEGPGYVTVDAAGGTRVAASKAPTQSPDKKRTAFIRDDDLWLRELGAEPPKGHELHPRAGGVNERGQRP